MSLLAYKLIAPTLLAVGLMIPAITLWTAGYKTDFTYGQDEVPYTKYLNPAPIMMPNNDGHYRSLIVRMTVRNFQSADTICRYFTRIRDRLYFHMLDYPELLDQEIGILDLTQVNLQKTIDDIVGKGRINELVLLDKEVMGDKEALRGNYKCYGSHAEVIY